MVTVIDPPHQNTGQWSNVLVKNGKVLMINDGKLHLTAKTRWSSQG